MIISTPTLPSTKVNWNGVTYMVPADCEYCATEDSLIVTSPYHSHNIELKKTKDFTNFNKNLQKQTVVTMHLNNTHNLYMNPTSNYGAIVLRDDVSPVGDNPYNLKKNSEIVDVHWQNTNFMNSFVLGAQVRGGNLNGT